MEDVTIAPPAPAPDWNAAPFAKPIAHWTHTLALCLLLAGIAVYTHGRTSATPEPAEHVMRYSSSMIMEWLLLGSVIAGIYLRRDFFLRAFRNPSYSNAQSIGFGVLAYVAGTAAIVAVSGALYFTPLGKKRNTEVVLAMLPHKPLEFVLWLGVSLSAGICEELIFRGYLLQQVTAWTRRPVLAVLITALLFGSVHAYEGLGAILPLAALAVVYGFVVQYFKGDLRSVIIAHTLQDFLVAVLALLAEQLKQFVPR